MRCCFERVPLPPGAHVSKLAGDRTGASFSLREKVARRAGWGYNMRRSAVPRRLLDRARHMRQEDTLAEKLTWVLLRDRRMFGLKFRRQVPIEGFIVGFYCHELRLVIELDGTVHDSPQQILKDEQRNRRLKELGRQILRVPNGMVMKAPDVFAEEIGRFIPHPALRATLSRWERDPIRLLPKAENNHNPDPLPFF